MSSILLSWYKGLGFDSWSGNWVLHAAAETQHSQINIKNKERKEVKVIVCLTYLISVGKRDPNSSTSLCSSLSFAVLYAVFISACFHKLQEGGTFFLFL